ncbi:unnamed protein product [Closterium sp. NIES-54]
MAADFLTKKLPRQNYSFRLPQHTSSTSSACLHTHHVSKSSFRLHPPLFPPRSPDPFTMPVGKPLAQVAMSEAKRNWPFVFGFAVTGYLVAKLTASLNRKSARR